MKQENKMLKKIFLSVIPLQQTALLSTDSFYGCVDILELVNKYEVIKGLDQKINILPIIISPYVSLKRKHL